MLDNQNQSDLFAQSAENSPISLQGEGLSATYLRSFISSEQADIWFAELLNTVTWQQDEITVYGKRHLTPRLSCWMGESWMAYTYSNHTMQPKAWQYLPKQIKQMVEAHTGESFNSVLLNYYRDGQDSNGWHADDEPELGMNPVIASVSLGAGRDFLLRQKRDHSIKHKLYLEHGSLLMMQGRTQEQWQHHVPKRAHAGARMNLTFRKMVHPSSQ